VVQYKCAARIKLASYSRQNVDGSLIAVREFENAKGELAVRAEKLSALNNYFEAWPTDEQAATATDDDFFDDEDDE